MNIRKRVNSKARQDQPNVILFFLILTNILGIELICTQHYFDCTQISMTHRYVILHIHIWNHHILNMKFVFDFTTAHGTTATIRYDLLGVVDLGGIS